MYNIKDTHSAPRQMLPSLILLAGLFSLCILLNLLIPISLPLYFGNLTIASLLEMFLVIVAAISAIKMGRNRAIRNGTGSDGRSALFAAKAGRLLGKLSLALLILWLIWIVGILLLIV